MMKKTACLILVMTLSLTYAVCVFGNDTAGNAVPRTSTGQIDSMKINLRIGDRVLPATLFDNDTARDFMALLPLTLTLEDYARTEKISTLPKKLSIRDAPAGSDPSVGDIAYYAPWGNLAIFHKDFGYSAGLVILGKIDAGIEALQAPGGMNVIIEPAE